MNPCMRCILIFLLQKQPYLAKKADDINAPFQKKLISTHRLTAKTEIES